MLISKIRRILFNIVPSCAFVVFFYPVAFLLALVVGIKSKTRKKIKPRILWGVEPIINIKYWSQSINHIYDTTTFVFDYYKINSRSDFDIVFMEGKRLPMVIKRGLGLLYCILQYDVFFLSYRGFYVASPNFNFFKLDGALLRLAGKKTVVWPYGSDFYAYKNIRDPIATHALLISYPGYGKMMRMIERRVDYYSKHADAALSCMMSLDGQGRWDVLMPSHLIIDTNSWEVSRRLNHSNGMDGGEVVVSHAPNHRGVKGTEYILEAIKDLRKEGFNIGFLMLEGVSNDTVKENFSQKVDIVVEALVLQGYGMTGLEAMASGLPVVTNLTNEIYTKVFRDYSFLNECPAVAANTENIKNSLRTLVENPSLRAALGKAGREYAVKYHSTEAGGIVFDRIIRKIWFSEDVDLINYFHPLIGEYAQGKSKVEHPLVKNNFVSIE